MFSSNCNTRIQCGSRLYRIVSNTVISRSPKNLPLFCVVSQTRHALKQHYNNACISVLLKRPAAFSLFTIWDNFTHFAKNKFSTYLWMNIYMVYVEEGCNVFFPPQMLTFGIHVAYIVLNSEKFLLSRLEYWQEKYIGCLYSCVTFHTLALINNLHIWALPILSVFVNIDFGILYSGSNTQFCLCIITTYLHVTYDCDTHKHM